MKQTVLLHRLSLTFTLAACAALPPALHADTVSYAGNFATDDVVQTFSFNVALSGGVTLQTFSYAGGVDAAGNIVSAGGFDPVLTLFDGSGNFLVTNDDGPCGIVGIDPMTANCFDSYISLNLNPGSYIVAVTEADNLPIGNLSDAFTQVGNGNFTCPEFLGTPGGFCDASPSQRDGQYELDITTPGTSVSTVPEPAPGALLLTGIALLASFRKRLQLSKV